MPSPKTSSRRPSRRSPPKKHAAPPARQPAALPAQLAEEWWTSWRRANALGWDYLNALSGLVRLPFTALAGATRFRPPLPRP